MVDDRAKHQWVSMGSKRNAAYRLAFILVITGGCAPASVERAVRGDMDLTNIVECKVELLKERRKCSVVEPRVIEAAVIAPLRNRSYKHSIHAVVGPPTGVIILIYNDGRQSSIAVSRGFGENAICSHEDGTIFLADLKKLKQYCDAVTYCRHRSSGHGFRRDTSGRERKGSGVGRESFIG